MERSSLGCVIAVLIKSIFPSATRDGRRHQRLRDRAFDWGESRGIKPSTPLTRSIFFKARQIMDALLQPPLRLAKISQPKEVSVNDAKSAMNQFMQEFKLRSGSDPTTGGADLDVSNSGGVVISQLIQLRNGLEESK
jgi:hypothetical protein